VRPPTDHTIGRSKLVGARLAVLNHGSIRTRVGRTRVFSLHLTDLDIELLLDAWRAGQPRRARPIPFERVRTCRAARARRDELLSPEVVFRPASR